MAEDKGVKQGDLYRLGLPIPQGTTIRAIDDLIARPFNLGNSTMVITSFPYNLSTFATDLGWDKVHYERFRRTLHKAVRASLEDSPLTEDQKPLVDAAALATLYILSRTDGDNALALTDEDRVVRGQNAMDPLQDISKVVDSLKARLSDSWRYIPAIRGLQKKLAEAEKKCAELSEREDSLKRDLVNVVNGVGYDGEDSLDEHLRNINWAILTGGTHSEMVPYALRALNDKVRSLKENLMQERTRAELLEKDLEKYESSGSGSSIVNSEDQQLLDQINQEMICSLSPEERKIFDSRVAETTELVLQGFNHRRNKSKVRKK